MAAKPYLTSRTLIDAVKRKIMLPINQGTFTEKDVLAFANEEMMISQVPSVLEYHQEYFVFKVLVPLVDNTSRYPIPTRAVGMRLRDVMWTDNQGNLFEMTRINPEEKYIFQQSTGSNQAIISYYLEGNDVVLTPTVTVAPTGSLALFFYIRPNQLVDITRAAIIENFVKNIEVDYSLLTPLTDYLMVSYGIATQTPSSFNLIPTARTITSNSVASETVVTCSAHGVTPGDDFVVYISEVSGSTPTINGNHTATAIDATSFSIPVNVTVGGTGGFYALADEFSIGSTNIQTAANLANTLTEYCDLETTSSSGVVTVSYDDITLELTPVLTNELGLVIDQENIVIQFDQLPTTWTDSNTNVTESLFETGGLVDFLQTNPGHKTFTYDVTLVLASGSQGTFLKRDLQYYASTGTGQVLVYLPIQVGDYIGLANECIIPQIPPDLHNGLAERTAARILAAIGDQVGLDRTNLKIAEIDKRQGNLLDSRVDGATQKVTSRHSPLSSFKRSNRWGSGSR